ncbi:YojF family protein [Ammoniphilus resinae]|uniref:DUF1806 family protein n=1 Tax=Ammoniphilus resinae TaxID=861532 RepID=A0ABS4GVQ6_9BACL|nr:hypothetical protein [Ammoniphilus resinae]
MQSIRKEDVQQALDRLSNQQVYVHLESNQGAYTQGAYPSANKGPFHHTGVFIRNAGIRYSHGKITGDGPFRIGLKMEFGWVYAEGLTDWEQDDQGRILFVGYDLEGRLAVALDLSQQPL